MAPRKADGICHRIFSRSIRRLGYDNGDWWVTPNANDTDHRTLLLDAGEAERLAEDPRLRPVFGISHPGRLLWVVRRMT